MSNLKETATWLKNYHELSNYISAAMLYLKDNFLLEEELKKEHLKPRILGHWGTVPGLNLIYGGLDYLINKYRFENLLVVGPGHGAPAVLAGLWIEGTLEEFDLNATRDEKGLSYLIKNFSWPGGYPSHTFPGLPGSIHEGGELGYSLGEAYGTVLDNPNLITTVVIGDGEAETGPLAASWNLNKFINPKKDGLVFPILHLNGYRISGPTVFGTMSDSELRDYFFGLSYEPIIVDQYKLEDNIYEGFLVSLEDAFEKLINLKKLWDYGEKPLTPLIILRTKKGWTGPKFLGRVKIEDNNLSHGIPLTKPGKDTLEFDLLKNWLSSYKVFNHLTSSGSPKRDLLTHVPKANLRLGASKYAIGGNLLKKLNLPNVEDHAIRITGRGTRLESSMENLGQYIRDIFDLNTQNKNFRLFSPDESESNLISATFTETNRGYIWPIRSWDDHISHDGRVMELLSEHVLMEAMVGYNLTGRYGMLISYEAFLGLVTNQAEQYIKFLKQSRKFSFRKPIAALNLISTSTAWRQEHNGFSHQNPTLINALLTKHSDLVRIYFPSDVNTMIATFNKCLNDTNRVNLIIVPKRQTHQWLTMDEAKKHVKDGVSIWNFVDEAHSSDVPDVVLASAGSHQTDETLAAINLLNELEPSIKIRYINVNELTSLGMGDKDNALDTKPEFYRYFTEDRDVVFNFHGYPEAIKQLTWGHEISMRMKVLGYIEEGTTTTPFDMQVQNKASRYHVAIEAIKAAAKWNKNVREKKLELISHLEDKIIEHSHYIRLHGDDTPEVKDPKFAF